MACQVQQTESWSCDWNTILPLLFWKKIFRRSTKSAATSTSTFNSHPSPTKGQHVPQKWNLQPRTKSSLLTAISFQLTKDIGQQLRFFVSEITKQLITLQFTVPWEESQSRSVRGSRVSTIIMGVTESKTDELTMSLWSCTVSISRSITLLNVYATGHHWGGHQRSYWSH